MLVSKTLADWGAIRGSDEVELCARELFGNVVRHAGSAGLDEEPTALVVLRHWPGDRVRIEVSDRADAMPVLRRPPPEDQASGDVLAVLGTTGRGLLIVHQLADALSWQPGPGAGKTVWCEFVQGGRGWDQPCG